MLCTVEDVRNLINLTATDISDELILELINIAQGDVAQELYIFHEDERVACISNEKENTVDSSNTTFYTKNYPLADRDRDGVVTEDDVEFYKIDSDGVRTEMTITSVTESNGKIVLSSAPTTDYTHYITYSSKPKFVSTADLKYACAFRAAALAYLKVEPTFLKHLDTLDILRIPDPFNRYMNEYHERIKRMKSGIGNSAKTESVSQMSTIRSSYPLR